ncbi:pho36-regulatory role in lipid and phosphate metabolism [Fusarium longipes]|uniref:Pho36-regulatory role in lipid and phosphate metabolism n=1 Tax=Fusarium longipes TaxID=694270 RepID=A0A395SEP9_9HYPO|nr:pho36-regulatory role in lipid and phosphate metabolism [Fusarium longipes]
MTDTQPYGVRNRRPSATENLVNAAKNIELKAEHSLLLLWDDLPAWRRDNAFILSGYRQSQNSYAHSFRSLFYLHNESVNIWTHLIGAIVFLGSAAYVDRVVRPRYASASSADVLVFACFFGGAVVCLGMSATFHTLSNHSDTVAKWGNKLDYTGIVALIVGSYVPALYYGFFCLPNLMTAYLWVICILGIGCALASWVERFRTPTWRPYRTMMFIGLGLSGVVPVIHGAFIYGFKGLEDRMSLSWVILHGAMYIFGAVLYAVRWPERSAPGAFDIWGSSHQIFHIFVILAAVTHFYGMAKAFDYHHTIMGSQCLMD